MSHIIDEVAYNRGTKAAIIRNAQKTFLKSERNLEALDYAQYHDGNEFMRSMVGNFDRYGKLTEKQVDAILVSKQKREAALKAKHDQQVSESVWYFENGKRLNLVITDCKTIGGYDTDYGYVRIVECTISTGEKVIYKGSSFFELSDLMSIQKPTRSNGAENEDYNPHATLTIKATIEHTEYNGVKQTMIKRPAIDKKSQDNTWLLN